jgi:hypothetical protein
MSPGLPQPGLVFNATPIALLFRVTATPKDVYESLARDGFAGYEKKQLGYLPKAP